MDTVLIILASLVGVLSLALIAMVVILIRMSSSINSLKMHARTTIPPLKRPSAQDYTEQSGPLSAQLSVIKNWSRGELIGRGGFGKVFLAIEKNSGALFATKQVPLLRDVNKRRMFKDKVDALRQEIKTLSSLRHENIVQYLGTSKSNRNLYVHLEFIEGGSLAQLIQEFGCLSLPLIQHYTQQILNGLKFLHSKGLVHRDIKPNNILVSKNGCCKLADFGCAKRLDELCERVSYSGTAIYMSPESHRQKDVGSKSDIWSLGCTIIEMANGHGPVWTDYGRYKLFVYISGKNYDPKIPEILGEDGTLFTELCMMQKPENRADAETLLSHSFMTQQQPDFTRERSSLHRIASNSSFKTIPNITRYVSDDSGLDIVDGGECDGGGDEKLKQIYINSMKAAQGDKNVIRQISLSRQSSIELTLEDVQNVIDEKAKAIKQMHLKWLVAEKTRVWSKTDDEIFSDLPKSNEHDDDFCKWKYTTM